MFGEIEVLLNTHRTDFCKAPVDSLVLLVDKQRFLDELNNNHDTLFEEITQIVRTKNALIESARKRAAAQRAASLPPDADNQDNHSQQQRTSKTIKRNTYTESHCSIFTHQNQQQLQQQAPSIRNQRTKTQGRDSIFIATSIAQIEQIEPIKLPNSSQHFRHYLRAYNAYKERLTKKKIHVVSATSLDENPAEAEPVAFTATEIPPAGENKEISQNIPSQDHIRFAKSTTQNENYSQSQQQQQQQQQQPLPGFTRPRLTTLDLIEDTIDDSDNDETTQKNNTNEIHTNKMIAPIKPKLSKFSQATNKNQWTRTSLSIDQRRESALTGADQQSKPTTPYVKSKDGQARQKVTRNRKQISTIMGSNSRSCHSKTPTNRAFTHVTAAATTARQDDNEHENDEMMMCSIHQHSKQQEGQEKRKNSQMRTPESANQSSSEEGSESDESDDFNLDFLQKSVIEDEQEDDDLEEKESPFGKGLLPPASHSLLQAKLDKIKNNKKIISLLKQQYASLIKDVNIKKNMLHKLTLAAATATSATSSSSGKSKVPSRTQTITNSSERIIPIHNKENFNSNNQ